MTIALIRQPEKLLRYGDIPEHPAQSDETAEIFEFARGDYEELEEDFVKPINDACDTLLDYCDVDYFDAKKCTILKDWLEQRLQRPCSNRQMIIYSALLAFATEAIELDTGVVVELEP